MVKILIFLLALLLSIVTTTALFDLNSFVLILIIALFTILYLILFTILFFVILWFLTFHIDNSKETDSYSSFYRRVFRNYCMFCLALFGVKIKFEGKEKIPTNTNFVIVGNHRSNIDSFIMDACLKDVPLIFVAKKSLFKIPFFGRMIHKIGYLKLDRENPRKALETIKKGIEFLKFQNVSVGVFPEGTRNFQNNDLLPFKDGCLHLAVKSQKPIVISVISGTEKVRTNLLFKKHIVTFRIIKCLDYEHYSKLSTIELGNEISKIMLENIKEIEKRK